MMTSLKNKPLFFINQYHRILFLLVVVFSMANIVLIITSKINEGAFTEEGYARWIFYYHVPIAWNASISFLLGGVNSFLYLKTKQKKYDDRALALAELGALFGFLVLFSGFIWAKPVWGHGWNWEPRLTTTLILELIYVGYFMIKAYGGAYEKTSIYRSYISLSSIIMIPVVYYSVNFLRDHSLHPGQGEYLNYGGLQIFLFSLLSFSLLLQFLYVLRIFRLKNKI